MITHTFEKIYESTEKFLTPLTLEQTYSRIVNELLKLSDASIGSISLYENGIWQTVFRSIPLPKVATRKRGFTYKAFKLGEPLIVNYKEIVKVHPQFTNIISNWKRSIFIPLSYGKKRLGVVTLIQTKGTKPDKKKLEVLKIFSSLATLAIRKTQLYNEIKDALDVRELFISMAAHELKTPLTTINAYVQLLQKNLLNKEPFNEKWIEQLATATERLKKLVFELLQIEQIKKGELVYKIEKVDLLKVINQAINDFKVFNSNYQILFLNKTNGEQIYINGDFDKLMQVINNVLNNSAKFSRDNTIITIILEYESPYFIIKIKDKGIGISQEDLPNIFDKFYKGKQKNREGLGLGLFLSKRIITKHKGKMIVESEKNKGTLVKLIIPTIYVRKNIKSGTTSL